MTWISLVLLLASLLTSMAASQVPRPNVLVILADDLGYGDLGCYGHPVIQTPNLDHFASQGIRFRQCYSAAANCSPSRAGLLSGVAPTRLGIRNWIPMYSPVHLRAGQPTLASQLAQAGYQTAHFGKWHLNGDFNLPSQPQPNDHGFQYWFSTQNNALPNHRNPTNYVRNGIPAGPLNGYSADQVNREVIDWLNQHHKAPDPFFLWVCYHEPHEPIATDPVHSAKYPFGGNPSRAAHHGNITQMDAAFGRLMRELDQRKLADDTVVFFTSDNGPAITSIHPHGSSGPLKDKKGYLSEGGIRVPGLLRWPGVLPAGITSDEVISGLDLMPTLCEWSGAPLPQEVQLDGISWSPMLQGRPLIRTTPLFWHFNHAQGSAKIALRDGDWKITANLDRAPKSRTPDLSSEDQESFKLAEPLDFELYHLQRDVAETENVAPANPEILEALKAKLLQHYERSRQESPVWPDWTWPRYESSRIVWPEYRRR